MKQSWVIVHFQPLEKYPPVFNFIRYVEDRPGFDGGLHVITTHPGRNKKTTSFSKATIHYAATWKNRSRFRRLLFYIQFNVKAIWLLFRYRPRLVLYYETLSAFAPLFYKKWINTKTSLFIHYHEYTSQEEYKKGMALNRWLHAKEKQLYPVTAWVSHTNTERLNFFLKDIGKKVPPDTYIMPNYPPQSWRGKAEKISRNNSKQIGFVYVGALSLQSMHTREMAQFVADHPTECFWHIYSANHDREVIDFLNRLNAPNIIFKGEVLYDELPMILPRYDIGVILYKGDVLNYAYNAPNKFFEYLACGLNVWFGRGVKGLYDYRQQEKLPWVECVDFDHLQMPPPEKGYRAQPLPAQSYYAEEVFGYFWDNIQKHLN